MVAYLEFGISGDRLHTHDTTKLQNRRKRKPRVTDIRYDIHIAHSSSIRSLDIK